MYVLNLIKAEWVEIPYLKPSSKELQQEPGNILNDLFFSVLIVYYYFFVALNIQERTLSWRSNQENLSGLPMNKVKPNTRLSNTSIFIKPNKTSVREVFGTYDEPVSFVQSDYSSRKQIQSKKKSEVNKSDDINKKADVNKSKKPNAFATFLSILKSVQSNLLKNAHDSIKNKLQILVNLKNNLLMSIGKSKIHILHSFF